MNEVRSQPMLENTIGESLHMLVGYSIFVNEKGVSER